MLRDDDGRLLRGRRTRQKLRDVARALIGERGFDGATLRAIAERAGMGASSIYRHVRSKEELLVWELSDLQDDAWTRFRRDDDRRRPTRERVLRFAEHQFELLAARADFTTIAMRALTFPEERVARQVLQLHDRTIGLLTEILMTGRKQNDLASGLDVLAAARVLFFATLGPRTDWANGQLDALGCRGAVARAVELVFDGIGAH